MTQKVCAACGGSFECRADSAGCWCEETKLSSDTLAMLRSRYEGCLCPRCLAAAAEGKAQDKSAGIGSAA